MPFDPRTARIRLKPLLHSELLLGERTVARVRAADKKDAFPAAAWVALAIYAAMVLATVARHEPWADEAQAWLIARDRGFWDMLWRGVRYEGTPGLWHALLWIPAHTGMPYAAMGWIAAAIAIAGAWVLLRYAPFPLALRIVLPFTFFLGYQYAVVARSYVLFPLLIFVAAACFRARRTVGLAIALALLANVSSHGFVVAGGLALAYAWFCWRERQYAGMVPAMAIFAAGAAVALVTAWQPPDVSFVQPQFTRILHRGSGASAAKPAVPAATVPAAPGGLKEKAARALHLFTLGISTSLFFSGVIAVACLAWLIRRRGAALLIPLAFLLFVLAAVYMSPWHAGMVFVTLVAMIWIAWPARPGAPDYALALLLGLACLLQLPWTIGAVRYDLARPYDGSEACARYLATVRGARIFGFTPYSSGVLPWFRTNIFANQPRYAYWFWSTRNHAAQDAGEIAAGRPDLVVIAYEETLPTAWSGNHTGMEPAVTELRDAAEADGYRMTRDFKGTMPMDGGFTAMNHCEVYERGR